MPTPIASVQGLNPYFLGTDTPVGVDATGTDWAVSFSGRNAYLTATFASGVSVQFSIPTTSTAGSKSGSVASFDIPNFGSASWTTYAQHVKFEVRFPGGAPKVTNVSVNIARQSTTLMSDGNGGVDVLSNGVKVGALPRPFLDYTADTAVADQFGNKPTTRVWLNWVVADPTMTLSLPTTLSASEWATAVLDPTVITTSTASTATAYSNQRKLDRTQNGVLWAMYWDGTSGTGTPMHFRYSTDNGATWSDGGGFGFTGTGATYVPSGSLFIDVDDYAHVAYKDRSDGYIYYRRGTPNAGRTAWAWGSATQVRAVNSADYPDVVAHREGTGWVAHVVYTYTVSTTAKMQYVPVTIDSAGTPTVGAINTAVGQAPGSNSLPGSPSIDFHHTGDGKTVAGGTPHLYVAWSAGATGTGSGIRFAKATYSSGSWTWGTQQEIDSTSFAASGRISSVFDGTRVTIAYADSQATSSIKVRERDEADTTTTTRTPTALSDGVVNGVTTSYDSASGKFFLGAIGATSADPKYVVYDRGAGTWGAWTALAATTTQADTLSARRGATGFVYTDGTASPFNVQFAKFSLGISASINPATEADTGTPLGGVLKVKSITPVSEADSSLTLTGLKTYTLVAASETDTALGVSTGIVVHLTPAVETELALALGAKFSEVFYTFTPPTVLESMPGDVLSSRYRIPVGQSVVKVDGVYRTTPYPWLGTLRPPGGVELIEGQDWFAGGRTYVVNNDIATALRSAGYAPTPITT